MPPLRILKSLIRTRIFRSDERVCDMATGKRYYWMKLKESFMTSDTIDYFMSQKDGANYVVLYQMLCLKTINTDGRLSRQIGEVIIPYDIPKIQRDLKWFSTDTIRVALELYKAFGLIYEDVDGVFVLTDHNSLVGSESDYAKQKMIQRRATALKASTDTDMDNGVDNVHENVHTDIENREREKILDNRAKSLDEDVREVGGERSASPSPKHKYGEYQNVLLSDKEYETLKTDFPNDYEQRIERLSEYIECHGKKYKNHLAVIRSWARKDRERTENQTNGVLGALQRMHEEATFGDEEGSY